VSQGGAEQIGSRSWRGPVLESGSGPDLGSVEGRSRRSGPEGLEGRAPIGHVGAGRAAVIAGGRSRGLGVGAPGPHLRGLWTVYRERALAADDGGLMRCSPGGRGFGSPLTQLPDGVVAWAKGASRDSRSHSTVARGRSKAVDGRRRMPLCLTTRRRLLTCEAASARPRAGHLGRRPPRRLRRGGACPGRARRGREPQGWFVRPGQGGRLRQN
jgi:hypothetical protein